MLASINPLGERARNNRWWLTVSSYVASSTAGGAVIGAVAGTLGWAVAAALPGPRPLWLVAVAAAACWVAAGVDLAGRPTSGPRRQVNEDWLGVYRGWVYGAGFGAQLGAGLFTIVTTATVYLCFGLALLSGSPATGAVVGALFGLARAAPVVATAGSDRPETLRRFHRRMQRALPAATRLAATTAAVAGAAIAATGVGARIG